MSTKYPNHWHLFFNWLLTATPQHPLIHSYIDMGMIFALMAVTYVFSFLSNWLPQPLAYFCAKLDSPNIFSYILF
jgi:hypothetical protein